MATILEIAGSSSEHYYKVNQSVYLWLHDKPVVVGAGASHKEDVNKTFKPIDEMGNVEKLQIFEWIFK